MSLPSKIVCITAGSLLAFSAFAGSPRAIDEDRAYHLATLYLYRYIALCGAAENPTSHGKYWDVPLHVGQGAELYGSVRIEKFTGAISYRGSDV